MPTPVEGLLNSPLITFSFVLNGASGSRLWLSSIAAPSPLADHFSGFTPQPMNCTTNRFGTADGPFASEVSAPQTGTDSSQGSAMATPAPFRKMRRERFLSRFAIIVNPSRSWSPTDRLFETAKARKSENAKLRRMEPQMNADRHR